MGSTGQYWYNGIGRRTGMTDAAGTESWTYDAMGRVLTDRRTTNGVTKTVSYGYNLEGSVASVTYPSGRVAGSAYILSFGMCVIQGEDWALTFLL